LRKVINTKLIGTIKKMPAMTCPINIFNGGLRMREKPTFKALSKATKITS
jgi:hypothetical protein